MHRLLVQHWGRIGDGGAKMVKELSVLGRPDNPHLSELSGMIARSIEFPGEAQKDTVLPENRLIFLQGTLITPNHTCYNLRFDGPLHQSETCRPP